jgi:hypothetical protein
MKLPNGDKAVVEEAKLLDYFLSPTHPRGKHKARLFAAALDITAADAPLLKAALLIAARNAEATATKRNAFGQLYEIRFTCSGPTRSAEVLSVWIVLDNDPAPRLVTCYPV